MQGGGRTDGCLVVGRRFRQMKLLTTAAAAVEEKFELLFCHDEFVISSRRRPIESCELLKISERVALPEYPELILIHWKSLSGWTSLTVRLCGAGSAQTSHKSH